MFKLLMLEENLFRVIHETVGVDVTGDRNEMEKSMRALGVHKKEILAAISDMKNKGTNCADFGAGLSKRHGPLFLFSDTRRVEQILNRKISYNFIKVA